MPQARVRRSPLLRRLLASLAAVSVTALALIAGTQTSYAGISTEGAPAVTLASGGSLDASGITAGSDVQRILAVQVPAVGFSRLSVTAYQSSLLDQDPLHGLQLRAEGCDGTWTQSGQGYTCSGRISAVVLPRPVAGVGPLFLQVRPVGGQLLRLTLWLPSTAGAEFMGQASSLSYRILN